jgi:hypothetical protein
VTEKIALLIELFGWRVVQAQRYSGKVDSPDGTLSVGDVWELASRWSPPPNPLAIIWLRRGDGSIWGLEVGVLSPSGKVTRFKPPLRWRCAADSAGHPNLNDPKLEAFIAGLGSFRTFPAVPHR